MKNAKNIYWEVWKQRFEPGRSKSLSALPRQPLMSVFICMSLVLIFSSNVSGSPKLPHKFIIGNLQNPIVSIPGKSTVWNNGIALLINQVLDNIPPGGNPKIGVFDFKAMGANKSTEFSSRFKEDIFILLSQVESLQVKEVRKLSTAADVRQLALDNGLDYFIRGFYKHGQQGLSIWSQLISANTGHIVSSGKIEMADNAIFKEDLALLDRLKEQNSALRAFGHSDNYDEALDHLIALKPNETNLNVKVWTDKKEYTVGDKISIFVKAEKPCYLILFDVRPNGETNMIFPNQNSKDNFIEGGKTYQIPVKSSGIEFHVQGPAGLERLKALVSTQPGVPLDLDWKDRFYPIEKNSLKGIRDLNRLVELFSERNESEWTEAYMEVFINEENQRIMRGSRKIPLIDKPRKPIDMIGTMGQELERK
jgi:TolB-like protein